MRRVVVLGRGGAGKTTAARQIGARLQIPVVELDQLFWSNDLQPMAPERWASLQADLATRPCWVLDGDLGPHDVVGPRLRRADAVVVLDFSLLRCAWRAIRRSSEQFDFWRWVVTWRHRARPGLLRAVAEHAPHAEVHVLRNPRQLRRFLARLGLAQGDAVTLPSTTSFTEVLEVLADLSDAGCAVWVAGGWGVDALVGRQTRPHRDLDLAVDAADETTAVAVLADRGYRIETDQRPVRVELVRNGTGRLDVHPVVFDEFGHGRQAGLDGGHFDYPHSASTTGSIDGIELPCLSREQQVGLHRGYRPRAVDVHDLRLLDEISDPSRAKEV